MALVLIACLGLLAEVTWTAEAAVVTGPVAPAALAPASAVAEREFGEAALAPVATGILIYNNRFIKPPYIIARHGLDILINGLVVEEGQAWPPFDPLVPNDPGDPPAGTHPWDKEDPSVRVTLSGPWSRKCRYLLLHFPLTEARRQYADLIAKSAVGIRVALDADEKDLINITFPDGHTLGLEMGQPPVAANTNRADYLEAATSTMERFRNALQAGQLVGMLGAYGQWGIDPKLEQRFFDILLSRSPAADKIQLLAKERFLNLANSLLVDVLEHFDAGGDELYLRFGKVPPSYDGTPAVTGQWVPTGRNVPATAAEPLGFSAWSIGGGIAALAGGLAVAWFLTRRSS